MRKIHGIIIVLVALASTAFAQGLTLENDSDLPIFVRILGADTLSSPQSLDRAGLQGLMGVNNPGLLYLPARTSRPGVILPTLASWVLVGQQDGGQVNARFLRLPGAADVPALETVRLLLSQAQVLALDGIPVVFSTNELGIASSALRVDGLFTDWLDTSPSLVLRSSMVRRVIQGTRESQLAIPANKALTWQKAGTDLASLSFQSDRAWWYGMVASNSGIASGFSLVMRFRDIVGGQSYTLEVPVWNKGGPVLLWTQGQDQPVVVGAYTVTGVFLEFGVERGALPEALRVNVLEAPNREFGLSVLWSDGSMTEEWDYGTFPAGNLLFVPRS